MKSSHLASGKEGSSDEIKRVRNSLYTKHCLIDDFSEYLRASKAYFDKWFGSDVLSSSSSLEKFEVIRTIGTGTFGHVVLANFKEGNVEKYLALKIMPKELIVNMKAVNYILNEKRVLESINFPFCVFLVHSFHDSTYVYLSMPFCNGGELSLHLKKLDRFNERTSSFYAAQIVLCIEYLHYLQLAYRDLKPENILLDNRGYIRLTDFGFCKRITGRAYTFCGTPEYIAPEIITNQGYGQSVDWWSLGVLIFEMNAGYPPFRSNDPWGLFADITSVKYTVPSHFSKELTSLITCLLEKDISKRFGALKNGVDDIKLHSWFRKTDWTKILNKEEDAPIMPLVNGPGDSSYFEEYENSVLMKKDKDSYELIFERF